MFKATLKNVQKKKTNLETQFMSELNNSFHIWDAFHILLVNMFKMYYNIFYICILIKFMIILSRAKTIYFVQ